MSELTAAQAFGWEFFGTAVLLLFGNGVCAANALRTSPAKDSGWVLIAFGWGLAVFLGASVSDPSGGHINPAVTIATAITGDTPWSLVPAYIAGQLLGAITGAILAWAAFKKQFDSNGTDESGNPTDGNASTTGIFFTAPADPAPLWNFVTEVIATVALLSFILFGPAFDGAGLDSGQAIGPLKYFAVAFAVVAIGMSLGSPTGYAINPARDLGPRLAYAFILPIKGKGSPNWGYAWVPVAAPIVGAILTAGLSLALN